MATAASRARQEKALLRSCEQCRSAKAKCVPSNNPDNPCHRCERLIKECVFAEAQPRPKRGKQTHTRVAEVEKKLDNIYALLQSGNQGPQAATESTPSTSDEQPNDAPRVLSPMCRLPAEGAMDPTISNHRMVLPDVIDKGIIDAHTAQEFLHVFRSGSAIFPFVVIPPGESLDIIRRGRPFLFLTAMAMAANQAPALQLMLDKEIRETLGVRLYVNGEQSLDLLQGLLVYLAWYYYYFKPFRQQLYGLSQLTISMVHDLTIGKNAKPRAYESMLKLTNGNDYYYKQNFWTGDSTSNEARRAYVGSWYIASSTANALRKPCSMKYNSYVTECCEYIASKKEYSSDSQLIHLIRIQRIVEEVGETFGYGGSGEEIMFGPERIQLSVRAFVSRLHEMWSLCPNELRETLSISLAYHSAQTYVYEVIMHIDTEYCQKDASGNKSFGQSWKTSPVRTELLLGCLESTKSFLDKFLQIPAHNIRILTMLDMIRLTYNVLVIAKVVIRTDATFATGSLRSIANLTYYFDALTELMEGLAIQAETHGVKNIFFHFKRVFQTTRDWIEKQSHDPAAAAESSVGRVMQNPKDLNVSQIYGMAQPAPVCQEVRRSMPDIPDQMDFSFAAQDEFWDEFMGGWPTSLDGSVLY